MSDEDQSDQNKSFLARWSQRKHEAKQPEPKQGTPVAESDVPSAPVASVEPEPEFDLSSLPTLEELTPTTDMTVFLRKGVPEHLRNAALRKSWALDPAIRNYVNPALDYAYDWNTPGGVPGSSEIGTGMDVGRLVSQIMGGEPAAKTPDPAGEPGVEPALSPEHDLSPEPTPGLPTRTLRRGDEAVSVEQVPSNAEGGCTEAGQSRESGADNFAAPQQAVRRHGTAKPID